ncbi:tetratricopeptide repeat protein [Sphingomonas sp.]|uniref:tetratricopeptide repeat protein n=1 Tax=Sphingomonas sp. TaxID=28214 RepID=UPI003B000F7D
MRFAVPAAALSLTLLAVSSGGSGQKPDDQVAPRSTALQRRGEGALAAGNPAAANDALEAAIVADPRNRAAFVALGRVAQAQGLPGKAIRYYKDALQLDPNDPSAVGGEGEALVQRGAVDRAKANLARLQTLCKGPCPQSASLAAAIAKGPPPAVRTAQASDKVPPKGQETTAAPAKN